MGRDARIVAAAVGLTLALLPCVARAQRPICSSLQPDEQALAMCRPLSLFPAVRFLSDFTVDHLFKPAPPPFHRTLLEAAQVIAAKEILDHEDLKSFLTALAPVRFTQLDRTTGSLIAELSKRPLALETTLDAVAGKPRLSLHVPARLDGGYWRGPDVLQMAFWEGSRTRASIETADGPALGGELECLSLTPDALLLRFAGSALPPVLVQFRECAP